MSTPPVEMPTGTLRATAELWILEAAAARQPEGEVLELNLTGLNLYSEPALALGRQLRDWGYLGEADGTDELAGHIARLATTGLTLPGRLRIDQLRDATLGRRLLRAFAMTPAVFVFGAVFGAGLTLGLILLPQLFM